MPKPREFQTNFSSGLLSSGMFGRLDLIQYKNGAGVLSNWWPKITGGLRRRPGSLYLATVPEDSRLEGFIFNETQIYTFAFADTVVRIYNPVTGALVDTLTDAPWGADEIDEMTIEQQGDTMFVAHENWRTVKILRTSATTFTLNEYTFETSPSDNTYPHHKPFIKFASPEVTLTPDGVTGTVALVASADVFDAAQIGDIIRYRGKQMVLSSVSSPTNAQASVKEELDAGLIFTITNGKMKDFIIGEVVIGRDSGKKAEYVKEINSDSGVFAQVSGTWDESNVEEEIEGLQSEAIALLGSGFGSGGVQLTTPPAIADWDEQAFSDFRGWPGIIRFHSQRLWLGGSISLPAHVFGSGVAAFFNFDVGVAFPDESIQHAMAGTQINRIMDFVSGRHFQIFTDVAELYAPESENRPLTPEDFFIKGQTRYGTRRNVKPKVFDESTLFVQNNGNAVREYVWRDSAAGYASEAISLISEEAVNDIQQLDVLYGGYDQPEQIALFVNGDGTIAYYHSARAEQVRAWGIWKTDGNYKSVTVIADKLYALVERTINSQTVFFLERLEMDLTVDAAVQVSASAQTVWSGAATHLANHPASVVSDSPTLENAFYLGDFDINGAGDLDLVNFTVDNVTIGLNYKQSLEPLPFEVAAQDGVTVGEPKRLVSVDVILNGTLALQVNGQRLNTYQVTSDLSLAPVPVTTSKRFYFLGYNVRPTVTIENDIPVPCEVLALSAEVLF